MDSSRCCRAHATVTVNIHILVDFELTCMLKKSPQRHSRVLGVLQDVENELLGIKESLAGSRINNDYQVKL